MAKAKQPPDPLMELKRSINIVLLGASIKRYKNFTEVCEVLGLTSQHYQELTGHGLDNREVTYPETKLLTQKVLEKFTSIKDDTIEYEAYWNARRILNPLEPSLVPATLDEPPRSRIHEIVLAHLPPASALQPCKLYYFQQNAAEEAYYKLFVEDLSAILIRANTGDGKTFAAGQLIRWIIDSGWLEGKSFGPYKILYVTKASIVEQTTRDLEEHFGISTTHEVMVTNYDSLRARLGSMFLQEKEEIRGGELFRYWVWTPFIHPIIVIWDECHSLKNEDSDQSLIAQAFNNLNVPHIKQIFMSATPFSRISGAKAFCVATRIPFTHGLGTHPLTNRTWSEFAKEVAGSGNDPYIYSRSGIQRLMKRMKHYIVGFRNVRRKHKCYNNILTVLFDNPMDQLGYQEAFNRYLEKKAKYEKAPAGQFLIWVELIIYQIAAERYKVKPLARQTIQALNEGKAVLIACKFKPTIALLANLFYKQHGIPRDEMSLIWGGDSAFLGGKEKKYSEATIQDILQRIIRGENVPKKVLNEIAKQAEYESSGLSSLPRELDLGVQSRERRQEEIDKFQSGKSKICLFTFKSGGAGLSLHHCKEYLKQRRTFINPVYNEMDLAQASGRGHRINSLSDTYQSVVVLQDTIEHQVVSRVMQKGQCLSEVIRFSEQETKFKAEVEAILKVTAGSSDEDEGINEHDYEEIEAEVIEEDET